MRVVTLIENTCDRPDLCCEHGLSFYIETGDHRILFDAGQSDAFWDNAEKLGIDLRTVDMAILSHGHFDHGGGLKKFLACNKTAPLYLRRDAFLDHYNADGKNIGLDPALEEDPRLHLTEDFLALAPGITLCSCNDLPRPVPTDSAGLLEEGAPDPFLHEQYLLIREAGKKICFSGCSHKGILNITAWLQPDILFGGFHFMKMSVEDPRLEAAAQTLLGYPTVYYTGHCTGLDQYAYLKSRMGDRLHALSTGTEILL